jgi:hypothetical protein
MSTVQRWFTPPLQGNGDFALRINLGQANVSRGSGVFATICELSQPSGEPLDFPFIGAARMAVHNIAPQDDGSVLCWVQIEWGAALNYRVQLLVSND